MSWFFPDCTHNRNPYNKGAGPFNTDTTVHQQQTGRVLKYQKGDLPAIGTRWFIYTCVGCGEEEGQVVGGRGGDGVHTSNTLLQSSDRPATSRRNSKMCWTTNIDILQTRQTSCAEERCVRSMLTQSGIKPVTVRRNGNTG